MRRCNDRVNIQLQRGEVAVFHVTDIFNISFRPLYRGEVKPYGSQSYSRRKVENAVDDLFMHRAVAHDAIFADFLAPGLKLRLYKADNIRLRLEKALDCGKNELYGDEGHVHHGDVEKLRNLLLRHIA